MHGSSIRQLFLWFGCDNFRRDFLRSQSIWNVLCLCSCIEVGLCGFKLWLQLHHGSRRNSEWNKLNLEPRSQELISYFSVHDGTGSGQPVSCLLICQPSALPLIVCSFKNFKFKASDVKDPVWFNSNSRPKDDNDNNFS